MKHMKYTNKIIDMRTNYRLVLRKFFHRKVSHTRVQILGISQEEMAHRLALSSRSYVDLDHGKTACSAVTLALFLIYVCDDSQKFLEELRCAFEEDSTSGP